MAASYRRKRNGTKSQDCKSSRVTCARVPLFDVANKIAMKVTTLPYPCLDNNKNRTENLIMTRFEGGQNLAAADRTAVVLLKICTCYNDRMLQR